MTEPGGWVFLQAVWYLKAQALTEKNFVDDTEMDEEGAADLLLDENQRNAAPRCALAPNP